MSFHAVCLQLYRERSASALPAHVRERDLEECRYLAAVLIGEGC